MRRLLFAIACAVLFALGACGQPQGPDPDAGVVEADSGTPEDSGTPPPDAGQTDAGVADAGFGPIPIDQWCETQALARCNRSRLCLSLSDALWDECMAREQLDCDQAALSAGVAQGRLQYLPAQAADCINAYPSAGCTDVPTACEPVFQGLVPPDGGCLLPEECLSGSYCLASTSLCPSTCYAHPALGEPCNFWDAQCDPTLGRCANPDGGGNRCVPYLGTGEPCQFFSDCRADLACINGTCVKRYAGLGETCRQVSGYPLCEVDTFCRQPPAPMGQTPDAGVCVRKAALGGVCSGYGTCITGLRCSSNYATGTCIPLGAVGDTCTNYNDCQQELYCSPPTSRCMELPGEGGDCGTQGSFFQCRTGYYCDYIDDTCKPLSRAGEPCNSSSYCESNICQFGPLSDGGSGYRCVDACLVRLDGGF